MDRFDRIFALHKFLAGHRRPVPLENIMARLECSRATAKRIIHDMRHYLDAPIVYDRQYRGYCYDRNAERPYELPGLWFSAAELHALLAVEHLLEEVGPGLLKREIAPLKARIRGLLEKQHTGGRGLTDRIKILTMGRRAPDQTIFSTVATATARRQRLAIQYHARSNNEISRRTISPQHLAYYRDNWYVDAWCHLRQEMRTFSLERVISAQLLETKARDISNKKLGAYFTSAYGIFSGAPRQTAILRFTPQRARWVAEENWHPLQHGRFLDEGSYELRVPYNDARELIMEILKHGAEVVVIGPEQLRNAVAAQLKAASSQY